MTLFDIEKERVIVVNKYHVPHPEGYFVVNCMRPGEYGNPFRVGKDFARGEAVEAYRKYVNEENIKYPKLIAMLESGVWLALECCCAPKSCHANVIKEKLLEEYNGTTH